MTALPRGYCTFVVNHEKRLVPSFFKVSVDHPFDNLESVKRIFCFGKKSGKSLEIWLQKFVRTLQSEMTLSSAVFTCDFCSVLKVSFHFSFSNFKGILRVFLQSVHAPRQEKWPLT